MVLATTVNRMEYQGKIGDKMKVQTLPINSQTLLLDFPREKGAATVTLTSLAIFTPAKV